MRDADFGEMAYKLGPARQIRDKILDSARGGSPEGEAQKAVVRHIRLFPTKTEAIWLRKYDAEMRQGTLAVASEGADSQQGARTRHEGNVGAIEWLCTKAGYLAEAHCEYRREKWRCVGPYCMFRRQKGGAE